MINIKDPESDKIWDEWSWLGPKRRKILERGWPGLFRNLMLHKLPVERLSKSFD